MISCTLILSHVICALCTHETNEPKKVERTSTLDYVCEFIYTEFWAKTFVFVQRIFFLDSSVILNRLLVSDRSQCFTSCFCFWLYVFFFSSFVVRYIFSQYRKSASKFFLCMYFCAKTKDVWKQIH